MNIVCIGSGNVATHLAQGFQQRKDTILQIYSPTLANARALANVFKSSFTSDLAEINPDADLYIIAVSDTAIAAVVAALPADLKGIVLHTSGATELQVLHKFAYHGVIYPPQSLSKTIATDLAQIPFCVEGSDPNSTAFLLQTMRSIAPASRACDSTQRLALHTASVMANNFSNALYQMAYDLLQAHQLPFDLIKPLILETAQKVQKNIPRSVQTGPAVRNDQSTIEKHLEFIKENAEWTKIYQLLTNEIIKNNSLES